MSGLESSKWAVAAQKPASMQKAIKEIQQEALRCVPPAQLPLPQASIQHTSPPRLPSFDFARAPQDVCRMIVYQYISDYTEGEAAAGKADAAKRLEKLWLFDEIQRTMWDDLRCADHPDFLLPKVFVGLRRLQTLREVSAAVYEEGKYAFKQWIEELLVRENKRRPALERSFYHTRAHYLNASAHHAASEDRIISGLFDDRIPTAAYAESIDSFDRNRKRRAREFGRAYTATVVHDHNAGTLDAWVAMDPEELFPGA